MLSHILKTSHSNLKPQFDTSYSTMFDAVAKSVVFGVAHMQMTKHLQFGHIEFECRYLESLRRYGLTSQSPLDLLQNLRMTDCPQLGLDLLPTLEDFLGYRYNARMYNYLSVTVDGNYNLIVTLKQV